MNTTIERITKLRQQIAWIDRALSKGEHLAAGLSIGLTVGANQGDYGHSLEFELSWCSEEVLTLIRNSLQQSLNYNLSDARKELADLTDFLNQQ